MNRTTLLILLCAIAAAAGGWIAGRRLLTPQPQPQSSPGIAMIERGELIPELALPDVNGLMQPLSQWRGKTVVINFWATWCAPCLKEMPLLDRFWREHGDSGLQVVGIALDSSDAVRVFLASTPVGYPLLIETPGTGDLSARLGNTRGVLPFSVLIDPEGRLRATHVGDFDETELTSWLRLPSE